MPYFIDIVDSVIDYLMSVEGLTPAERLILIEDVQNDLANRADEILETDPLGHESLKFIYDYLIGAESGVIKFEFTADASAAEMGVIRVVFADRK